MKCELCFEYYFVNTTFTTTTSHKNFLTHDFFHIKLDIVGYTTTKWADIDQQPRKQASTVFDPQYFRRGPPSGALLDLALLYALFKVFSHFLIFVCVNIFVWHSCHAQLRLSHDSGESSFVDSCASFFGSLWRHEHVQCTCPFVPLFFCLCVRWTPCLVLNPPFHNSKI